MHTDIVASAFHNVSRGYYCTWVSQWTFWLGFEFRFSNYFGQIFQRSKPFSMQRVRGEQSSKLHMEKVACWISADVWHQVKLDSVAIVSSTCKGHQYLLKHSWHGGTFQSLAKSDYVSLIETKPHCPVIPTAATSVFRSYLWLLMLL